MNDNFEFTTKNLTTTILLISIILMVIIMINKMCGNQEKFTEMPDNNKSFLMINDNNDLETISPNFINSIFENFNNRINQINNNLRNTTNPDHNGSIANRIRAIRDDLWNTINRDPDIVRTTDELYIIFTCVDRKFRDNNTCRSYRHTPGNRNTPWVTGHRRDWRWLGVRGGGTNNNLAIYRERPGENRFVLRLHSHRRTRNPDIELT